MIEGTILGNSSPEAEMKAAVARGDWEKAGQIGHAAGYSVDFINAAIASFEIELGRPERAEKILPPSQPRVEAKPAASAAKPSSGFVRRDLSAYLKREAVELAKQVAPLAAAKDNPGIRRRIEQIAAQKQQEAAPTIALALASPKEAVIAAEAEEAAVAASRREERQSAALAALTASGVVPAADPERAALLEAMNRRHAVITNYGGKCVVIEWKENVLRPETLDMEHQTLTAIKDRYMNIYLQSGEGGKPIGLGVWWLHHPARRSYDGIDLVPNGPLALPGNKLNLWQGYGVEEEEGDWSLIRWHIEHVLAADDPTFADYIIRWIAWKIQNPGEPNEVALVLRGGKGTGKGAFGQVLMQIFGGHALQIHSSAHLSGKHNKHLQNKVFLFADEAFWAGDREAERLLKGIVTEKVIMIEPKGVDAFQWRNGLSMLIAANEDWVVPASHDERRYAVNNISEGKKQDPEYFGPLFAQINGHGPAAMLFDLRRMALGDWHPRRAVPQTRGLVEQKMESLHVLDQWWYSLLVSGELPGRVKEYPRRCRSDHLMSDAKGYNARTCWDNDTKIGHFLHGKGCTNFRNSVSRLGVSAVA